MKNDTSLYLLDFEEGVCNAKSKILAKGGNDPKMEYKVPDVSAIYCLYSTKDNGRGGRCLNNLLYVGKTVASNGFRNRCLQHLDPERDDYLHNTIDDCPDNLCWYTYALLDGRSLEKCEAAMIKLFKPPLNKNAPAHNGVSNLEINGRYAWGIKGTWTISSDAKLKM